MSDHCDGMENFAVDWTDEQNEKQCTGKLCRGLFLRATSDSDVENSEKNQGRATFICAGLWIPPPNID